MAPTFFDDRRPHAGLTWPAYLDLMEDRADATVPLDDPEAAERFEFTQLNLHRSRRIARTWRPSEELAALAQRLAGPQLWMVLTEPWCGDSAQCLPCFAVLARGLPDVELRMLLRDDNLDIMDQYLTAGKRSIPVVVAFSAGGEELFRWGPRPAAAQELVDEALAAGLDKPARLERLHLWYGRDRGRSLDAELVAVLRRHLDGA